MRTKRARLARRRACATRRASVGSTRLERGLRLAHVERRGDERQRDDHAGRLEHELDPGVLDAAEEPVRAERGQQADARPRRAAGRAAARSSVTTQRAAAEAPRGEQVGGRRADDDDDRQRDRRCTRGSAAARRATPGRRGCRSGPRGGRRRRSPRPAGQERERRPRSGADERAGTSARRLMSGRRRQEAGRPRAPLAPRAVAAARR